MIWCEWAATRVASSRQKTSRPTTKLTYYTRLSPVIIIIYSLPRRRRSNFLLFSLLSSTLSHLSNRRHSKFVRFVIKKKKKRKKNPPSRHCFGVLYLHNIIHVYVHMNARSCVTYGRKSPTYSMPLQLVIMFHNLTYTYPPPFK